MKRSLLKFVLLIGMELPACSGLSESWYGAGKLVLKQYNAPIFCDDAQPEPYIFDFREDPTARKAVCENGVYEFVHQNIDEVIPKNQPIVVVVDVISVTLVAVTGLDSESRFSCGFDDPRAWYRVLVHVRKVEKGAFENRWFSFPVSQNASLDANLQGGWLFCRGITLKLGLKDAKGGYALNYAVPVSPYPPYSTMGIRIYGCSNENMPEDDIFSREDGIRKLLNADTRPLAIQSGDHTLAVFQRGVELLSEQVSGEKKAFYDFGVSSRVDVWIKDGSGNEKYWSNSWVADRWNNLNIQHTSPVTIHRLKVNGPPIVL